MYWFTNLGTILTNHRRQQQIKTEIGRRYVSYDLLKSRIYRQTGAYLAGESKSERIYI